MNRRDVLGSAAVLALLGALPAMATEAVRARPNFIVILCDDLGYGDIGPTGGTLIPTPHLDRMAAEGVVLTDYYAPASVCTPSRAGMLTGRYPIRTGLTSVIFPNEDRGLPLAEVTIPETLKPEYATALVGKWHLGHRGASWPPNAHGFDLFYGIPLSHDMKEPFKIHEIETGGASTETDVDLTTLQQMFWSRAERFLEEHARRPFFLELALSAPHLPNDPPPEFAGRSQAGAYGDVVMEIDDIAGRLLSTLERLGIDDRTLVIFTSDNGPWFEGSAGGLRNRKGGGAYDGAARVPFIARWPGVVPPGTRSDSMSMGIDLLPTFCGLAGKPPPAGVELDGRDIAPVLLRGAASPHDELFFFTDDKVTGVRTQTYKYVTEDVYMTFRQDLDARGYPQVYDLKQDPSESYSIAAHRPDVLADLRERLNRGRARFAPFVATAAEPEPSAGDPMPTMDTPVGRLARDPRTRALFETVFPGVAAHPAFGSVQDRTLQQLHDMLPGRVSTAQIERFRVGLAALRS